MEDNWIKIKDKKPKDREEVWLYDYDREIVCLGYYADTMTTFFNKNGTGIKCYHWQPVLKPNPPKV